MRRSPQYDRAGARRRGMRVLRYVLPVAAVLSLLFLLWPYATLWRLDCAVRAQDPAVLSGFVDLEAIRAEIKRKLNKDEASAIGIMSDAFILWLAQGIRTMGIDAVDRLVTLEWVRERLLADAADEGFLGQVSYAFFDPPDAFSVRIGPPAEDPVHVRLRLRDFRWRVAAVYY